MKSTYFINYTKLFCEIKHNTNLTTLTSIFPVLALMKRKFIQHSKMKSVGFKSFSQIITDTTEKPPTCCLFQRYPKYYVLLYRVSSKTMFYYKTEFPQIIIFYKTIFTIPPCSHDFLTLDETGKARTHGRMFIIGPW